MAIRIWMRLIFCEYTSKQITNLPCEAGNVFAPTHCGESLCFRPGRGSNGRICGNHRLHLPTQPRHFLLLIYLCTYYFLMYWIDSTWTYRFPAWISTWQDLCREMSSVSLMQGKWGWERDTRISQAKETAICQELPSLWLLTIASGQAE